MPQERMNVGGSGLLIPAFPKQMLRREKTSLGFTVTLPRLKKKRGEKKFQNFSQSKFKKKEKRRKKNERIIPCIMPIKMHREGKMMFLVGKSWRRSDSIDMRKGMLKIGWMYHAFEKWIKEWHNEGYGKLTFVLLLPFLWGFFAAKYNYHPSILGIASLLNLAAASMWSCSWFKLL